MKDIDNIKMQPVKIEFNPEYLKLMREIKEMKHYGKYFSEDIFVNKDKLIAETAYGRYTDLSSYSSFKEETKGRESEFFVDTKDISKLLDEKINKFNSLYEKEEKVIASIYCPYTGDLIHEYKVKEVYSLSSDLVEIKLFNKDEHEYFYVYYGSFGSLNTDKYTENFIINEFAQKPIVEIYGKSFIDNVLKNWKEKSIEFSNLNESKVIYDGFTHAHLYHANTKEISLHKVKVKSGDRYISPYLFDEILLNTKIIIDKQFLL